MKQEILDQIDKLKLMVLTSDVKPEKTEAEKFDDWCKDMQNVRMDMDPINLMYGPRYKWIRFNQMRALVEQLYNEKFGGNKKYGENRRETKNIISNTIAMMMYIDEQVTWNDYH